MDKGLVCSVIVQLLTVIILSVSLSHAVTNFKWQLKHGLITRVCLKDNAQQHIVLTLPSYHLKNSISLRCVMEFKTYKAS